MGSVTQIYATSKRLRKTYGWPADYLRKQRWGVENVVKRLGHRHDADWLARHIHRQLGPIYLESAASQGAAPAWDEGL